MAGGPGSGLIDQSLDAVGKGLFKGGKVGGRGQAKNARDQVEAKDQRPDQGGAFPRSITLQAGGEGG